jgi:hypothetical protein
MIAPFLVLGLYAQILSAKASDFSIPDSTHPVSRIAVGYGETDRTSTLPTISGLATALKSYRPNIELDVVHSADLSSQSLAAVQKALLAINPTLSHLISLPEEPSGTPYSVIQFWLQDWMKSISTPGQGSGIFVIPYRGTQFYQETLAKDLGIPATTPEGASGDWGQGGNIDVYPGKVLSTGSGISPVLLDWLKTHVDYNQSFSAHTSWLAVGHVDEVFSVVATPQAAPCNFALVHASPSEGLRIAKKILEAEPESILVPTQTPSDEPSNHDGNCLGEITADIRDGKAIPIQQFLSCPELEASNERYDQIIAQDTSTLHSMIAASTGCSAFKTVELPVIYNPKESGDMADTPVGNPVNLISVDSHLVFYPKQPNERMDKEVRSRLESLKIRAVPIDVQSYATMGGGLHCATQTFR